MKGFNQVLQIGNVARDPECKYTTGGDMVAKFTLAVEDAWKDGNGERKKSTNWIPVTTWGALAEKVVHPFIERGMRLAVQGRLRTYEYDKDGEKRYGFELVAEEILMLDSKKESSSAARP